MTTRIGEETDFTKTLEHLMALDYDAVEAYQAAIERLDDEGYRTQLESFKADHERHVRELDVVVRRLGGEPPGGPGAKATLTKGKVAMANIAGDDAILRAMKSNEDDTNTAYEKAFEMAPQELRELLRSAREDERRHWEWLASALGIRSAGPPPENRPSGPYSPP
jgi:uncharacterized protein (TIGR02284 family)